MIFITFLCTRVPSHRLPADRDRIRPAQGEGKEGGGGRVRLALFQPRYRAAVAERAPGAGGSCHDVGQQAAGDPRRVGVARDLGGDYGLCDKLGRPYPYIFISEKTGDRIKIDSIKTAKARIDQAAKAKAEALGIEYTHFTFHDLKRKGVTDTTGNKQEASGHRTAAMLNIYDVQPALVKAAGEN